MLQEYKKVLTYKKMYEDLIEAFQYIISDLFEYSNKNKIILPNRDRIYRNMEKARELIEYRIEKTSKSHTVIKKTSDENLQDSKSDGDFRTLIRYFDKQ